eukprot:m.168377 g.168377  ORF g.168377 m.168377 type:complete len:414 (+) comp12947_c0_seq1:37-1278(+)
MYLLATLLVASASGQPSITKTGTNDLTVSVPATGSFNLQIGTGAASPVATFAQVNDLNTSIAQALNASMSAYQGLGDRTNAIDVGLLAATTDRITLNASLSQVTALANQLSAAISANTAELTTVLSVLTQVNGMLAGCNFTDLSGLTASGIMYNTSAVLPNSGTPFGVPVGGSVMVYPATGYSLPANAQTTFACTSHGWNSQTIPTPIQCPANCMSCTATNHCGMCNSGYRINAQPTAGFARVTLNASLVTMDPRGLQIRGATVTPNDFIIGSRLLVQATPATFGSWALLPNYNRGSCGDPAWIQVDLGAVMHVGAVTVLHYYGDTRRYCGQRIALSTTGQFAGEETNIYNTGVDYGPAEGQSGNTQQAYGTPARYIRHWAAGSSANPGVHFMHIQATAAPMSATSTYTCVQQ